MIETIRLTYQQITKELADFLDAEAGGPNDAEAGYWYQRGAIEFAKFLEAACCVPLDIPSP